MKKYSNMHKYYKKVWRALHCSSNAKKKIIENLQSDVEEYLTQFPKATEQEVIEKFGEPEKYAKAFASSLDDVELQKCVSRSRFGKKFWIAIGIAIIIIITIAVISIVYNNNKESTEYYSEDIVYSSDEEIWSLSCRIKFLLFNIS